MSVCKGKPEPDESKCHAQIPTKGSYIASPTCGRISDHESHACRSWIRFGVSRLPLKPLNYGQGTVTFTANFPTVNITGSLVAFITTLASVRQEKFL